MEKHVKIILIAALAMNAKLAFGQTVALLTPSDISRTVNVSVSVAKKARIEVLSASNTLSVSNEDKTRGYVDLPKAIVLKIWCNSIDGARVMGQIDPSNREMKGKMLYRLSGEKDFREANGSLSDIYESYKAERGSLVSLDIRYVLAASATAGEYQFDASFIAEPK
jgi:DNA primase large subunit